MDYIIAFSSTSLAIKAEQLLLENKIPISVMPLPTQIKAGCGICLRVRQDELDHSIEILKSSEITIFELYNKKSQNGTVSYEQLPILSE